MTDCTVSIRTAQLIGKLKLPEIVSNFTFGGPKRNDLYITASSSVYALRVNFTGARYPWAGVASAPAAGGSAATIGWS